MGKANIFAVDTLCCGRFDDQDWCANLSKSMQWRQIVETVDTRSSLGPRNLPDFGGVDWTSPDRGQARLDMGQSSATRILLSLLDCQGRLADYGGSEIDLAPTEP